MILSIPLSSRGANDKRIWVASARGTFSVKSAYFLETTMQRRNSGDTSSSGSISGMWRKMWGLKVPDKKCPAAADVWKRSFNNFQLLWEEMVVRLNQEELELAAVIFYQLWIRRNGLVFQETFHSPSSIVAKALSEQAMYKEAQTGGKDRTERRQADGMRQIWKSPDWPFSKVNFDAAFDQDKGSMGLGVVVRDSEGELLGCLVAPRENIQSACQAECYALHRAMVLCLELGLSKVIEDLQHIMAINPEWVLNFVPISANAGTHTAAKLAVNVASEVVWLEDGPAVIKRVILDDLICIARNEPPL
ncbi:hypothetical protein CIPAW_01G090400 [Carya illinoinensis]|uniref:RNase H type-1 domain-containing protein n=1 Tax=Carya illinoinensis TaxID=32201 RepID=A0A8T1RMG6_CARIL|nr:hypothetical protein CIPAW_01G090400 [Carya illinoinensis]